MPRRMRLRKRKSEYEPSSSILRPQENDRLAPMQNQASLLQRAQTGSGYVLTDG